MSLFLCLKKIDFKKRKKTPPSPLAEEAGAAREAESEAQQRRSVVSAAPQLLSPLFDSPFVLGPLLLPPRAESKQHIFGLTRTQTWWQQSGDRLGFARLFIPPAAVEKPGRRPEVCAEPSQASGADSRFFAGKWTDSRAV